MGEREIIRDCLKTAGHLGEIKAKMEQKDAEIARMKADLAHLNHAAGDDSCADYVVRNGRLRALLVEARDGLSHALTLRAWHSGCEECKGQRALLARIEQEIGA